MEAWDGNTGQWTSEFMLAVSPTAVVKLDKQGRTLDLRSRPGHSQRMLFFDADDGRSVGIIEVNASGAFLVRKGAERATVSSNWPALWTTQTVALVRIKCPMEIVVTDRLNGQSGTIAYESRRSAWHVPAVFWERSRNYDAGPEGDDLRVQPVGLPPMIKPPDTPPATKRTKSGAASIASTVETKEELPQADLPMPPLVPQPTRRETNDPGWLNYGSMLGMDPLPPFNPNFSSWWSRGQTNDPDNVVEKTEPNKCQCKK